MGVPQQDVLEGKLPLVGYVPYRPLGQSHYVPAPWQSSSSTAYLPAVMSEAALKKGIEKAAEPLPAQISEERLSKVRAYLELKYGPIFAGDNFMDYAEAVSRLNLDKSPGFPYYYTCEDKGCALTCVGCQIKHAVEEVIAGRELWLPSTLTLKDELRTADRVAEGKTRVFSAGNIVALIVAKMLFDRQNDKLRKTLGQHPLTIGISVPGPQFVQTVLSLSPLCNCYGSDASGCDQRFYLPFARVIRDFRAAHLPPWLYEAVCLSYDQDFAGDVVVCGCVYKMFHNKSGRNNTGDDNGFLLDCARADYTMETTGCSPSEVDDYSNALFNGDDGDTAWWGDLSGPGWVAHCKQFNLQLELEDTEPRYACDVTFLSHHLIERFVPGLGDVMVAAGNKDKLLSSVEWIRRNKDFTLEENALTHLLGLRICLWPWRSHFLNIEELIDRYVDSIEKSPKINDILRARIPEPSILNLHLRLEGGVSFFANLHERLREHRVPDSIISAIFQVASATSRLQGMQQAQKAKKSNGSKQKSAVSKEEQQRRLRQSIRDKAATRQGTAQFALRNLPQRSALSREVLEVIGALIDPDNHRPFRLPDGGRKTFVNRLRDAQAIADNAQDTTLLTPSSGLGIKRRDPRCSLIVSKGGLGSSVYSWIFPNGTTTTGTNIPAGNVIPLSIMKYSSGTKRHGDFNLPWVFNDGRARFWFSNITANRSTINITGLAASTAYTFAVNWIAGKQQISDSITATSDPSGNLVLQMPNATRFGYVSLVCTTAVLPAGITITYQTNSTTDMCHLAAPDFWTTINDLDSIRVNSMSLMCSDRTNLLNTQGDVVAYQVSGGLGWDELFGLTPNTAGSLDPYTAVTGTTNLCYKGEYKKGRYLPAKSSGDARETAFIEIGDSTNPWDLPPIDFSQQLNYIYIGYNTHVSAVSGVAIIGEWTAVDHVEGESESQWRDSQSPTMHPDVLKEARHALADKEYDFENISHLSKIWNIIKGVGKAVLPVAQSMIPMLPPQFQMPAYLGSQVAGNLFNQ